MPWPHQSFAASTYGGLNLAGSWVFPGIPRNPAASATVDPQSGTGGTAPSAQAPLLDSALELLLPLGLAGVFAAVAYIYHHLSRRHAAANMSIPELVIFILSVSVGVLQYLFFVQPAAGGAVDHAARARAVGLGVGAHRALPTASTAAFYWGMMLIIVAHVRAGGEGGGGAVAGAGHGAIQGTVRLLTKIAVGVAAGLVFLVTAAFCIKN